MHAWKFTHFYEDPHHRNKKPEQMSTGEKINMIFTGIKISKSMEEDTPSLAHENIILHTRDGVRLEGWYIPADTIAKAHGTIIVLHGYGSSKSDKLPEAYFFHQQGYNTLLIDFRAHGNSSGLTCSIGYKETEDLLSAWRFVESKGEKHILLWGMSMGAATILKAVPAYHLHPEKIMLEAPFASLVDAVKSRMRSVHLPGTPFAQLLTFWGGIEQGFWGFGYEPYRYAEDITCPTLLCWGKLDTRVMETETQEIYEHLRAKNKQLTVFAESGHQSFCLHEPEKWEETMQAFLRR
ncbi:hypothetical protein GA0116948_11694 [Chitinophaga costaii]|uniref:Serine aminopeptidase S33 domain-containing protein n=2 Tax=Chitinophaga costaii TaxID=1335309 RepID=A0A1C4FT25_9BACT|nr:hypothetical protein GA0116948_11694 [Chitinophaga costaii]